MLGEVHYLLMGYEKLGEHKSSQSILWDIIGSKSRALEADIDSGSWLGTNKFVTKLIKSSHKNSECQVSVCFTYSNTHLIWLILVWILFLKLWNHLFPAIRLIVLHSISLPITKTASGSDQQTRHEARERRSSLSVQDRDDIEAPTSSPPFNHMNRPCRFFS